LVGLWQWALKLSCKPRNENADAAQDALRRRGPRRQQDGHAMAFAEIPKD